MTVPEKRLRIMDLLFEVSDPNFKQFFDFDSYDMLDEKIEVLEKLASGTPPAEIPNYYKVQEKYPKDSEIWD